MDRARWVRTVDRLLRRDWCLCVEDAGIDENQLTQAWADGEDAEAFVGWFAEKYDLIRYEPRLVRMRPANSPPRA